MTENHGQIADLKKAIEQTQDLPAIPALAVRLLNLKGDENAGVDDLAGIIELDPSLAGQIVRYATSPFFGYRGQVGSIREAVARVLGYERAMNVAAGLAIGKAFSLPLEGPIGLTALWRHAVYTAAFMQLLAEAMPKALKVKPGLAYLAGLLHNIGFLVLGHLFEREFRLLGEKLGSDTDRPWLEIEKQLLGADHTEIGVWLMRAWHMPPEVITTVFEHHNENYRGQHAIYANLALLANRMLRRRGIGDAAHDKLPTKLLADLALTEPRLADIFKKLFESESSLEAIAKEMASGV